MLWLAEHLHVTAICNMKPAYVCVQVTLLQNHSAEHLILGAARRSLPYYNLILLGRTDSSTGCVLCVLRGTLCFK